MRSKSTSLCLALLVAVTASACVAPSRPASESRLAAAERPSTQPKRVVAAIWGNANTVVNKLNVANYIAGIDAMQFLTVAFLARTDPAGLPVAQLAERVPSLENGLWELFPDGSMETTWKIRSDARWHDGVPITAKDLAFTATVAQDPELQILRETNLRRVSQVDVVDPQTLKVRWREPFIDADKTFPGVLPPLPQHVLEPAYEANKATFAELPYWSTDYVGAGPFKVKEFVLGSRVTFVANDQYVLGRPKVDEVEVQFIPDANTLGANLLSGSVELTLGRAFAFDQAAQIGDQWSAGRILTAESFAYSLFAQMIDPQPEILGNVQFRRALYYGLDRQPMIDALQPGTTTVPTTFMPPNRPEYRDVEAGITGYPYDPRRAAQLIEGLGYQKGGDGFYRDGTNQEPQVPILSSPEDAQWKLAQITGAQWQTLGVRSNPMAYPPQRASDREYINTRPGYLLRGGWRDTSNFLWFPSSEVPLASNGYLGLNVSRYGTPELDALISSFETTIPLAQRNQVAGQMLRLFMDELPMLLLFFRVEPTMVSNRISGVEPGSGSVFTTANTAHLWDVVRS